MKKVGLAWFGSGGSSRSSQGSTISQMNEDVQQELNYPTLIKKMEREIQICGNQIKELNDG